MGASLTAAEAFRNAGLNALQLGDEAILHPENFRLSGPDMRAVRQAVPVDGADDFAIRVTPLVPLSTFGRRGLQ